MENTLQPTFWIQNPPRIVRKAAALQAQKELADCMQVWGVSLLNTTVPEQMKYDFLAEAASHLMQVLNDPEHITG